MVRFLASQTARILFVLLGLGLFPCVALAQTPWESEDGFSEPDEISTDLPSPDESEYTLEDLAKRLKETQKRLETLEESEEKREKKEEEESLLEKMKKKEWYEKYTISGYMQFRYNEILDEEDGSAPAQLVGDSSVGDNQNFLIRRARLILSGDVNDYVSIYFQPDFASSVPNSPDNIYFAQIRDLYADLHFDAEHVWRVRVGQSKVPYGWENLQSSRNRLPLDRNDALNSAVRNERDLGAFFYWTPEGAQDFFKKAVDEGLKGSGNYGVLGFGVYNGQGGSLREQNDNLHFVSRLTLPIVLENDQMMEFGMQGYVGRYVVLSSPISPLGVGAPIRPDNTLETGDDDGILDERLAWTFVYYPQPLGFQAEWTVGRGPGLNDDQTEVISRHLYGGYLMSMYRIQSENWGEFWPFIRWNYYQGGYKTERNAPFSDIAEWELGMEWQFNDYVELVGMYTLTDRTNTTAFNDAGVESYQQFQGDLLRFQLQVRF